MFFPSVFCQNNASKLDICQQQFVYIFSCLFTFSSADCLLFRQLIVYFCQLFVYTLNFRAQILGFPPVFCQNNASKLDICQQFVYIFSCLFTFSAVCLPFCQLKSAVCLLLSADFSCLFTSCQLISAVCLLLVSWFLNFCAKIMFFWSLFCHYRCFNTLIVNLKKNIYNNLVH